MAARLDCPAVCLGIDLNKEIGGSLHKPHCWGSASGAFSLVDFKQNAVPLENVAFYQSVRVLIGLRTDKASSNGSGFTVFSVTYSTIVLIP